MLAESLAQNYSTFDVLTNTFYKTNSSQIHTNYSSTFSPVLYNWQMVETSTIQLIQDIEILDSRFGYISYYEGLSQTTNGGLDW
jgi:hypothetical protein